MSERRREDRIIRKISEAGVDADGRERCYKNDEGTCPYGDDVCRFSHKPK